MFTYFPFSLIRLFNYLLACCFISLFSFLFIYLFIYYTLIGMLLVSRSGLMEEYDDEVFYCYGFLLVLFFLDVKFQVLSGKIIMR